MWATTGGELHRFGLSERDEERLTVVACGGGLSAVNKPRSAKVLHDGGG